jgi:hypothetical protein
MKLKVFNIELDGIDKCGKDSVRPYVFYLEPGKYLCRARGLISQIAYAKLYKRNIEWDGADYAKNTLFVLLEVDKQDWEIRCKLTNEPNTGFTYEEMTQAFKLALYELKERFDVPENHILVFNTSEYTPYAIVDEIKTHLEYLNNQN